MKSKKIIGRTWPLLALAALWACSEQVAEPGMVVAPTFDASAEFVALSAGEDASEDDWFALAQKAREAHDFATAAEALEMASKDLQALQISLERARISVAQGETESAIESLQTMFSNGFTGVQLITGDQVLNSMAGSPAFDELVTDMSKQAFPCEYDERFREFDFWVGAWDVHVQNGQVAGSNRIVAAESGCVLTEHWVSAGGGTGNSINYVDKISGEWVQVWNSQSGTQINIRGGLTEEGMSLVGTIHYVANGTTAPFRGLWTALDDGRVRQYFEQSNDDGKTWVPWFEGYYTRQSESDGMKRD